MEKNLRMRLLTNPSEVQLIAETPHGKVSYWGKVCTISSDDIALYCDKEQFDGLCRLGCPNYGKKWSCPPYSPLYNDFSSEYQALCIVLLGLNLDELGYIKQDYLKVKAANSMLKSRVDRTLRMCITDGEKYVSTGSCRLCKPCRKKLEEQCAHPTIRTFSFEALGVNVSTMVKDIFDLNLLWYKRGSLPLYTCVVAGLLTNENPPDQRIISKLIEV